ncbi:MAG: hypothetical protein AAF367_16690 [Pseudomonadota bacterium]
MHSPRLKALAAAVLLLPATAQAEVFEVIHPDVGKGGIEFEILNALVLEDVDPGDEQSIHEFAIGYGITSFWKTTLAVEFATIDGDGFEYEAFEWENVFLFPLGNGGNDHDHDHGDGDTVALEALGFYAALEVPDDGGFDAGAVVLGPVFEAALGPVDTIGNIFVEIPFEGGENEAIVYAISAAVPVTDMVAIGVEAFGEVENAFTSGTASEHFVGPAAYFDFDIGGGRSLEPRIAVLFGTESAQPDATLSFNVELKF